MVDTEKEYENIPSSLMDLLKKLSGNDEVMKRIDLLCKHKLFKECEITQRSLHRGFDKFGGDEEGRRVIEHAINHVENSRQLAKIFSYTEFLDASEYDFNAKGYPDLGMNLAIRAQKNALPHLELTQKSLYHLFEKVHEIDPRVMDGLESLSTIYSSDFPEEIPILREIADKVFKGVFEKWRYSHDRAEDQMIVLNGKIDNWKKNMSNGNVQESDDVWDLFEFGLLEGKDHLDCLPAYLGDANKKLLKIVNEEGDVIGSSLIRLLDSPEMPMLFVERPYSNEWNENYSNVTMRYVIQKARNIGDEIGEIIGIGTKDENYSKVILASDGKVLDSMETVLPESVNPVEYSNGLGGRLKSGSKVRLENVVYSTFLG